MGASTTTLIMLAAAIMPGTASAQTIEDVQVWQFVTAAGSIKGDVVGYGEVQVRYSDQVRHLNALFLRGTIGYRVTDKLPLSLGYANFSTLRSNARDIVERRPFQQIGIDLGKPLGGALTTRIRLEQRWLATNRDIGWRYRQQLRWRHPVHANGTAVVLATEAFVHLNSTSWGIERGFDQLRASVAINLPITKTASVEMGYQAMYVVLPGPDRYNHVIPVTIAYRF